jgi:response regulator RpfG family c-di-GMP phosphodiesterase
VLLKRDVEDTQQEIIEQLAVVIETSYGSKNHTQRMVKICHVLGRAAKLSKDDLKTLCLAVPLYDIGEIRISENIMIEKHRLANLMKMKMKMKMKRKR